MKQKKYTKLIILFLCLCLLTSCKKDVGTDEDNAVPANTDEVTEENYSFGFSGMTMDLPFYITLEAAIREVIENSGSTMITKDPEYDSDLQISQINEMIEAQIDVIFLSPVDWEGILPALEALKNADVKIVNVDSHIKDTEYADAYIGSDNKNAGYLCGEDLINKCPDGGKVVILETSNTNSVVERITGFEEALAEAANGFTISVRRDVEGDYNLALQAAKDIFAEEEDIVAVMCGNDQSALGALAAANEAGLKDILIYGVDGSPDLKKELDKPGTLIAGTAAQSPLNMGREAANIGLAMMRGEDYEKETYTDVFFIDKENLELYGTDGWQ
ncbi:MAG: sugar ABC transporter substrate-binding protein [Lachnospiraceae bacterium]